MLKIALQTYPFDFLLEQQPFQLTNLNNKLSSQTVSTLCNGLC